MKYGDGISTPEEFAAEWAASPEEVNAPRLAAAIRERDAAIEREARKPVICGDCRRVLPGGHPDGYCPSREDFYF